MAGPNRTNRTAHALKKEAAGKTVNFLDPDGVQWEFHTSNLAERLTVIEDMEQAKKG